MNLKVLLVASLGVSLYLTGCARNNVNDNTAYRNRNVNEPARVNYNPPTDSYDGRYSPNMSNPNVTDVRYDTRNINNTGTRTPRVKVADIAAKKLADLPEVDTANVIVTDNNAFVAVKLASGEKLSNRLEKTMSNRVKSVDRDIDRVYISANPDFYKRMTAYGNDIRAGKPVSGFFNEFTRTIQRVFPDVK
ncbi:YhcN/YlaJ family sporulation lipoprotein [Neobacillus sp. SM06]|uniref:YhcN/YlaJ family sporulation lipoprotein n=1 Tax=Neobacillus sp. SM06 TaxID=3422492 RepID=UPI003D2A3637